jgi:hypothetical protein
MKSMDILLNLSAKFLNSTFNALRSRVIILVLRVGTLKIYVAKVEALKKTERQDETQFIIKIDGFLSFTPNRMLMLFFNVIFKISPCVSPNSWF